MTQPPWWPMADPPTASAFEPEHEWWLDTEVIRVSGNMECEICGMPYWKHVSVALEAPTLVRVCDGRLLKL